MIVREFGVRQGRKALASAPLRQACRRVAPLSTTTTQFPQTPTPTAVQDPVDPRYQTSQPPPSIFTSAQVPATRASRRSQSASGAGGAAQPDTTAEDYHRTQALKRKLMRQVGTRVQTTYRPGDVFQRPPGPGDVTLELLLASQAHMGHHTSLWNPANARYIFGVRQGIHVISLEQTAAHLRRAARVVEEVAYRAGLILFVGTRPGHTQIITQAARLARSCHLFTKWVPGSITNSEVILAGMPIQMVDQHDKPLQGFDRHVTERRPLVPDLVVCLNPLENYVLLHECALVNVPTIGVIDTNVEPSWVTYAIPANDDSLRCLAVIGSVLGRAGEAGHERRLADARRGIVAWDTPLEVQTFMTQQRQLAEKEAEAEARHVNRDGSNPQAADEIRANARGAAGGGERPWERQDEEW